MKQFSACCIVFLCISTPVFSQTLNEDAFNEAFLRIYMQTASNDMTLALEQADSLYQTAQTDLQQVRALMLIGDMHHRIANRDSTIHYALLADKIAKKGNLYEWQARIGGVLSTQYREIGLLGPGKKYLEMGMEAIGKVENQEQVALYRGQYHQELGYYALEENDFDDAITCFKQATAFFERLPESVGRSFGLLQNDERLGLCYLQLGMIDSAKVYYQNAVNMMRQVPEGETPVNGFVYNGLGKIHLLEKAYHEADSCLKIAYDIAENTGFLHLQIGVYQSLVEYYRAIGDVDKQQLYEARYEEATKQRTVRHKRFAENIIVELQQQLATMSTSTRALGLAASLFVVVVGIGASVYIGRQRRKNKRFKAVIQQLRQHQMAAPQEEVQTPKITKEKGLMPESTEQELLRKLERFESSQQFTDKNISIAVLAGKLKTNTKYLSYIINHHRNKDFNHYINELRINYIINKINEDSRYLNYKISYLAQECGFATHSQFTTVFRNLIGLSPSTFIACLKKDRKQRDVELMND